MVNEIVINNISIDNIIPYPNNARTHSDEQIKQISKSIKEFGFNNPILIDPSNALIAGHARLEAAKILGLAQVPTITLSHLTPAQKKAYILADNRIALNSGWSAEMLKLEFDSLIADDFDLDLTGFAQDEIAAFLNPEILTDGLCDEDLLPETSENIITKLGDNWRLGNHWLKCGDSTNPDDVSSLLHSLTPVIMITDPPYGVNYDPSWREEADLGIGKRSKGKVLNDDITSWKETYGLFTGDVVYVWHSILHSHVIAQDLIDCGFELKSNIIWAKQHFALSREDYHWQTEPCWYAVRKGKKHHWNGSRKESNLWEIKNNNSFGNSEKEETHGHGTQKPLECMSRPMVNNTKHNDIVYDPFGGSGTTLIAAEKLGRICLMMELSPIYCDVIVRRWQKLTNKQAILESSGKTFDEVSNG